MVILCRLQASSLRMLCSGPDIQGAAHGHDGRSLEVGPGAGRRRIQVLEWGAQVESRRREHQAPQAQRRMGLGERVSQLSPSPMGKVWRGLCLI